MLRTLFCEYRRKLMSVGMRLQMAWPVRAAIKILHLVGALIFQKLLPGSNKISVPLGSRPPYMSGLSLSQIQQTLLGEESDHHQGRVKSSVIPDLGVVDQGQQLLPPTRKQIPRASPGFRLLRRQSSQPGPRRSQRGLRKLFNGPRGRSLGRRGQASVLTNLPDHPAQSIALDMLYPMHFAHLR
ncbi:hypothetical protein TNCV_4276211 [Trichonephila clavipes]|nr:hypothetical protein TNCV_4276211 [Trichonephila clavipes]